MLKVLIAEDDLMIADMIEEALVSHFGYEVCGIATTVAEGMSRSGGSTGLSLAIIDIRLAGGGVGTDIAAQLDRAHVGHPVCHRQRLAGVAEYR